MKKTLIAMAAVAVAGAASAQVTLYGILDYGYQTTTTETAAGVQTAATSGMSTGVQSGSRWGMKGSEDLGGGLTASFQLESSITADTGASTGFTRTSKVAVGGGFGTFSMGRQYTPTFSLVGGTDVTGTDGTTTSQLYGAGVRSDSLFMYKTPSISGVTVTLASSGDNVETTAGSDTKTAITDVAVNYAAGAMTLGAARSSKQATAAGVQAAATKQTTIGATYDMGAAKLYINKMTQTTSAVDTGETNVGVKMPMGAATLYAGWGRNTGTSSVSSSDYVVGADYTMSKRTNAYTRMNKRQLVNAGEITNVFSVGLRHQF